MTCSCITRRRALGMAAFTALATSSLLAGCGDKAAEQQSLAPVEIDRSTSCELDGMLLADYPGPKAQIHYAGQEKPSFFCDTIELFNTLLAGEQVRAVRAVYVQATNSHDENGEGNQVAQAQLERRMNRWTRLYPEVRVESEIVSGQGDRYMDDKEGTGQLFVKIGRASCRERGLRLV